MKGYKFVALDFIDDYNVAGRLYWYLCEIESVDLGSLVLAPLGSHNRVQRAVVRRIMFADETFAPYPLSTIKKIEGIAQERI